MPSIATSTTTPVKSISSVPSVSGTPNVQTRSEKIADVLTFGAPSVALGFMDTVGTSIGIFDDDDLTNFLKSYESTQGLGDFYQREKPAAQAIGDTAGMLIPGMIGVKAFNSITKLPQFAKAVGRLKLTSSIVNSAKNAQLAERATKIELARDINKGALNILSNTRLQQLHKATKNFNTIDAIKDTVAFELGVLATMNTSDTLFPDDYSTLDQIALNSLLPTGAVVLQRTLANRRFRNQVFDASKKAVAVRGLENFRLLRENTADVALLSDSVQAKAAREIFESTDDTVVRSRANKDIQVFESSMRDDIIYLGKNTPHTNVTKKAKLDQEHVNTAIRAERKNTGINIGAVSFDITPQSYDDIILRVQEKDTAAETLRTRAIKTLDNSKSSDDQIREARKQLKQAQEIDDLNINILDIDGTLVPALDRTPIFSDNPLWAKHIKPAKQNAASDNTRARIVTDNNNTDLAQLSEAGLLEVSGSRNFSDLNLMDRSAIYKLGQRTVEKFPIGDETVKIPITLNSPHFKLDYVQALHKEYGDDILQHLNVPDTINTIEDIEFASLAQKYKEYVKLKTPGKKFTFAGAEFTAGAQVELSSYNLARRLNIPQDSKILEAFESLRIQGDDDLYEAISSVPGMPAPANFQKFLQEIDDFPQKGFYDPTKNTPVTGEMFRLPNDAKPILLHQRTVKEQNFSQYIKNGYTAAKAEMFATLNRAGQAGASIVDTIFKEFTQGTLRGMYDEILQTDRLIEGSLRGKGTILSREFSAGDNATLKAATGAAEISDRIARKAIADIYRPFIPAIQALKTDPANIEIFNLYTNMRRQGWDLKTEPVERNGMFEFLLDDTAFNRKRYKELYGEDLSIDTAAPTIGAKYMPLRVNSTVLDAARAIDEVDGAYLRNTNVLRRAKGLGNVRRKPWHVPPKDFSRKPSVVVLGPTGKIDQVIDGRTIQDAKSKASDVVNAKKDPGFSIVDQKDLANYHDIRDEAFEKMMDFSDVLQQTGRSKGTSASTTVLDSGPKVLEDILTSQQKHFESVIRRTRATIFESQLTATRQLMQRSEPSRSIEQGSSTYQLYTSAIMGNPMLSKKDPLGDTYFGIESRYDEILNKAFDYYNPTGKFSTSKADKNFASLDKALGKYNPFQSTTDYLERTHKVSLPPKMKNHMAKLNSLTALLSLRLLDAGHAVLTLTSLAATIPGVTKALNRQTGETLDRWKARIGAFGVAIDDQKAAMFNPMRLLTTAAHEAFTKEGREFLKAAGDKGFLDQAVAEGWATLVAPKQNYLENLATKTGDMLSIVSDKSEVLARGISFMAGGTIARRGLGIKDDNLAMAFAHHYANQVIGNYDPNNRPRMFQGAAGMPLGLFMTFMQNYLQRTFSYVENGQTRALATQLGTQAAVFGGSTVPGFNQFVEFFGSNYDGTTNVVDGLRNRYPEPIVDLLLYGSLSTLTDTALFQRGDANIRSVPTLLNPQDTPSYSMINNFYSAISDSVGRMRNSGTFSSQDIAEILGTYSTHRFTRGLADLYAGASVDRRGNVVDDNTVEDPLEIAQRMSGFRPMQEAKETNAYYQTVVTDVAQRNLVADLRRSVKTSIRGGNMTAENLNKFVANYVRAGGQPKNFVNWLKSQYLSAAMPRTDKKLKEILNNPRKMADILRLMSAIDTQPGDPILEDK